MNFALITLPVLLLAAGTPIFAGLLIAATVALAFFMNIPLNAVHQNLFGSLNFSGLLAVPFFIYAGELMSRGTVSQRLVDFVHSFVAGVPGALGVTTVGTATVFGAISGSSAAAVASVGKVMSPSMDAAKYPRRVTAGLVTSVSAIGIVIPPSIPMIVYGASAEASIPRLYAAGVLPGLLLAGALVAFVIFRARQAGHGDAQRVSARGILRATRRAIWALGAPIIVLGGIYGGVFSPTEAAGVTVGFCVIVGFLCLPIHRLIGGRQDKDVSEKSISEMLVVHGFGPLELPSITMRSAQITGILAPLIAVSVVMQQILSVLGAQQAIGDFVTSMGGYHAVLFTSMAIVFVLGMVLESLPVTIILAPILAPVAHSVGVEPVQFAVIFLVGASIGFITPPYGLNLYVASGVTGVPYFRLLRYSLVYLIALIAVWIIVALVPALSTALLPQR